MQLGAQGELSAWNGLLIMAALLCPMSLRVLFSALFFVASVFAQAAPVELSFGKYLGKDVDDLMALAMMREKVSDRPTWEPRRSKDGKGRHKFLTMSPEQTTRVREAIVQLSVEPPAAKK
jgi:hypothetical protein